MTDSSEFTPQEQFHISLYKDPSGLFRRTVLRGLRYLIPSLGLVAYSVYSGDNDYALFGYGILFFQAVYKLTILKRALLRTASIYQKYEAQLRNRQGGA